MQELPYAHGGPALRARLRREPEDFVVDEILGYEADGDGEHVLLAVRKREANTDWIARELARFADVPPLAVGYAGLKDRHAVTTQAFSVQLAGRPDPDWATFPHAEVLSAKRHRRKLKRGALAGNRFVLRLHEVQGDREVAEARLAAVAASGVPNYFGEQRFGLGGGNLARAEAMFAGRRVDKKTRSLLLSAARSHIFNVVLAERVARGCWNTALDGEIWSLAGSRSWFGPESWSEALAPRLAAFDIHPSGPLWGRGALPSAAAAAELESRIATQCAALAQGLEAAGLEQDRRALRLRADALRWHWFGDDSLELSFSLPPGTYATVVLREVARTAEPE
ncbi:tRNA pseudouridine(13) synthase TruD [Solimonas marina]|uniref:tRNA pseudouridine synthase D n=1 Tax=Solimonas marina TaxID=2714601 RepID=A0A969WC50_9GAMM|nr:tRNA pseudouridine(13) synthase TruD [Solimonas marina]NKF24656.1 tRNA pseudouridine(13) synthase TruD [Solimonas marina]